MADCILVVEDDSDIRELIVFTLVNHGYEVIQAGSAEEAFAQTIKHEPSLLILDLFLPDIDGISLCEMFRRLPQTAEVPVMMLTAWTTIQARVLGRNAGANDYMTKPFSPRELVHRVEKLFNNRLHAAS